MKPNYSRMIIIYVCVWLSALLLQRYFFPQTEHQQRPPVAPTIAQYQKQIDQLLTDARTGGASLSRSEREQKFLDASRLYDQIARLDPQSDTAIDARFKNAALF